MKTFKIIVLFLLILITNSSLFAQNKKEIVCYSDKWETNTGNVGYTTTIIKFNFKTATYQRLSDDNVFIKHTITDYQTGTLYGKTYVILWVNAPNSNLVKVGIYDTYVYEYYGDDIDSPFIIFYLYNWKQL